MPNCPSSSSLVFANAKKVFLACAFYMGEIQEKHHWWTAGNIMPKFLSIIPISMAALIISLVTLIYIVYGHQVGYYCLMESQLTADILYSMAAPICIMLVILIGGLMPLSHPVEIERWFFIVIMAPWVFALLVWEPGQWVVGTSLGGCFCTGGKHMCIQWSCNGRQLVGIVFNWRAFWLFPCLEN